MDKKITFNSHDCWRLGFHLMPISGWLNDPNGLCHYKGRYHVFFQTTPDNPNGGIKSWGHYTSNDLLSWEYHGIALTPEEEFETTGVYSGSALIEDENMHLFYTGNVKLSGDYDYINNGRVCSVIHVTSIDGYTFSQKQCIIPDTAYPTHISCHVRDPKAWREAKDNNYYMILGARTKGSWGEVLLYRSSNLIDWSIANEIISNNRLGYMWECPDFFRLDNTQVLCISPQGVEQDGICYQNIYQSGYFIVDGEIDSEYALSQFSEWDYGFDFYAPQTFEDKNKRRILIGWMGMPDAPEHQNPTVEFGWQHALTVPRELKVKDGIILQQPVKELERLRGTVNVITPSDTSQAMECYEINIRNKENNKFCLKIGRDLLLTFDPVQDLFIMQFENREYGSGRGRGIRYAEARSCSTLRVFVDRSSVEVFINEGQTVLSTRFYPQEGRSTFEIEGKGVKTKFWVLDKLILSDGTHAHLI